MEGGTPKNDFELGPGDAKAVFTGSGDFILPSIKDTVTGVDLTAGAKGANLGSLVSNTGSVPEKIVTIKVEGIPSSLPMTILGKDMGDASVLKVINANLDKIKSDLIQKNLVTAPGPGNMNENVMGGNRGQGTFK